MNILVTGAAGFIGSVVCAKLVEAGHHVIGIDNLGNGLDPILPAEVDFRRGSIEAIDQLISHKDSIDAVVHLAGLIQVGESMKQPEKYWQTNTSGTLALLATLRKLGISKFVFSSTAACYGTPERTPIEESDIPHPDSVYGWTKLAVDQMLASYADAYGWAALSLRYFNVAGAYGRYGERHQPETHIIPLALEAIAHHTAFTLFGNEYATPDGTNVRDYLHVADLADAHILALDHLKTGQHDIVNLSTGLGSSNYDIFKAIETVTGQKLDIDIQARRAGDPAILVASNAKAKQLLGWQPKYSLSDMVRDAWKFKA